MLGGYFYHARNVFRVGIFRLGVVGSARREKILARKIPANNFAVACRRDFRCPVGDVHNFGKPARADNVLGILHGTFLGRVLSAGAILVSRRIDGTLCVADVGLRPVPELFDAGEKNSDAEIFRDDIFRFGGDNRADKSKNAARHVEIFRLHFGFATRANPDVYRNIFRGRAGLATRLVHERRLRPETLELGNIFRAGRRNLHFATIRLCLRAVRRRRKNLAQRDFSSDVHNRGGILFDGLIRAEDKFHVENSGKLIGNVLRGLLVAHADFVFRRVDFRCRAARRVPEIFRGVRGVVGAVFYFEPRSFYTVAEFFVAENNLRRNFHD